MNFLFRRTYNRFDVIWIVIGSMAFAQGLAFWKALLILLGGAVVSVLCEERWG